MITQMRSGFRRHRQSGVALITFAAAGLAILGATALALDLGMAYLTRTRLQNALDAAALDGAQTLNLGLSTGQARTDALAEFNADMGAFAPGLSPVVEFSPTLTPFSAGGADPIYVRVKVGSLPVAVRFANALGISALAVGGSAVAGPAPIEAPCGALPVMVCQCNDPKNPDCDSASIGDTDCTDLNCFGIDDTDHHEIVLKQGGNNKPIGPGNYGLIVLNDAAGPGGKREELALAGDGNQCFKVGDHRDTEPGVKTGPVDGLNTRFDIYTGDLKGTEAQFPPDTVITSPQTFAQYSSAQSGDGPFVAGGVPQRRVVLIPIAACPKNGRKDIPIVGQACFFLTQPAGGDKASIFGEMIGSCPAGGNIAQNPNGSGAFKVILYKDPDSPQM